MSIAKPGSMGDFATAVRGAAGKKVVMQFSAEWCGNCESIKGDIAALAEEVKDKVAFVYVDMDELADCAEMYEVTDLPTFVAIDPSNPAAKLDSYTGSKMDQITPFVKKFAE